MLAWRARHPCHLQTASSGFVTPAVRADRRKRADHLCQAWQEAVSPDGQKYYWLLLQKRRRHTETRETAWTLPSSDRELRSAESHQQSAAATSATTQTTASAAAPVSRDKMLSQLLDAVQGDQTGMLFAETARSLRSAGVFEDEFFDFLTARIEAASRGLEREAVERVRARLCNPLLRQAAPFE